MVYYKHDTTQIKKSKIKTSDFLITILLFYLIFIILTNPTKYSQATISGFMLFAMNVFPTLFPFIVISKILSALNTPIVFSTKLKPLATHIFRAPGSIVYVYFLSIICGYPLGAKLTADFYENGTINKNQALSFCNFCSTSGILFVVGTIGIIMFNSLKIGIIIYISHIFGSFIGGLILSRKTKNPDLTDNQISIKQSGNIITHNVSASINSILVVGAYITLFCLFTQILCDLTIYKYLIEILSNILSVTHFDTNLLNGILSGIFEMTNGCKILSSFSSKSAVIFATGLISFGGISIIFQSQAFLQHLQIKTRTLVKTKFVHCIFSMLIASILVLII